MGQTQPIETVGRRYIDGVVAAGGLPVVLPALPRSSALAALDDLDGLLLTGGGDVDPARYGQVAAPECGPPDGARDAWELALVEAALDHEIPILGICRGAQVLNVAFGGALIQHLPERDHGGHDDVGRAADEVHQVTVASGSRLARVLGAEEIGANTLHHQAIDPARIGSGLVAVGTAEDGVVEAVEPDDLEQLVLGVQWHPELMLDRRPHQALFDWLVDPERFGD